MLLVQGCSQGGTRAEEGRQRDAAPCLQPSSHCACSRNSEEALATIMVRNGDGEVENQSKMLQGAASLRPEA